MGALQQKYLRQDANLVLFDNAALTADTDSSVLNFGVAGGCPEMTLFFKVGNRATGESVTFLFKQSSDNFSVDTETLYLRLHGIAAATEMVVHVDNSIITKQYFKLTADVTLPTAGALTVNAYGVAIQK